MRKEAILVVDDEGPIRAVVVAFLEHEGYATAQAANAEDALDLLRNGKFNAVLSDLKMPGTDGLELLDAIKRDFPALPVVLFSAVHELDSATSAFRRGAFDYMLKPFERRDLVATMQRALRHAHDGQQNVLYREYLEHAVAERTQRLTHAMKELERSYDVTLEVMGDALDLRDHETEGHSKRVTAYCIALARSIGVDAEALKVIARGAFLHDIGKIATPDAILLKPSKLTDEEMSVMRRHCECGYETVRKIPFLEEASVIVRTHQEKFDGTGYPQGLAGAEIPLGARIFAVADTLDAITSDRPYRKGASFTVARQEIERCAGTQFDPEIVAAFLALPQRMWSDIRAAVGKNSHYGEMLGWAAA